MKANLANADPDFSRKERFEKVGIHEQPWHRANAKTGEVQLRNCTRELIKSAGEPLLLRRTQLLAE